MLDIRRLVMLREVHLRGSITAAAKALSYSHSGVSQQLALLEKDAGVPLLEKVGRGVRLTPAAEELVIRTDEILAVLERAQADLAISDTQVRGTLRLAAFTTIARSAVPRVVALLKDRHPHLDVRFRQVEPEEGALLLASRRVDALVADSYPETPKTAAAGLHADLLIDDPIRAYLPRGIEPSSKEDLKRLQWVLEPVGTEAHAWALRLCHENGFDPDVAFESEDLLFHLRAVESGVAAAFIPDLVVREASRPIRSTTLLATQQFRQISLVCRAGAETRPAIVACRQAFEECLQHVPATDE